MARTASASPAPASALAQASLRSSPAQDISDTKSNASTTASSGTKRKRDTGPKFYAVRVGHAPGIYHSWADCMAQIKGFKNASFKSFPSLTEAEAFIDDKTSLKAPKPTLQKYYAIRNGRVPGVYTDWPAAQRQIIGWKGPKHKSFPTTTEAIAFVKAGPGNQNLDIQVNPPEGLAVAVAGIQDAASDPQEAEHRAAPAAKKQKKTATPAPAEPVIENGNGAPEEPPEAGTGPLPPDAEDGFDRRIILNAETGKVEYKTAEQLNAKKKMAKGDSQNSMLRIYTDGSSLGNGKNGAIAGVGVFFGPGDKRNVSEPLPGSRQTNQRAELTAIARALDITPLTRPVTIYSDSKYAIQCVTEWFVNWRRNGWINSSRKPVENKDLIEPLISKIEERRMCGAETKFEWCKGHVEDPGNVAADALAVKGARDARLGVAAGGGDER
ncbi:hypothetical protein W97_00995 [Coniosporium apollinis CBS 100218]|uniref:ribonuclease H n=1 Tax=Coniosporium apollinis (strain CBS 100218) TaxID=1168221 RepID=R7YJ01_CONA1|nr:uncharacterized protein W97_00995 [Coniosporium apollinis CBS 100218]EON61779.1 hypothetical protein W97_00995 [Coniosporium apollinis CBS 100218]